MQYIINDVGVDASCFEQFGIKVLEVNEMTQAIKQWQGWSQLSVDTTRIFLPGNGALDVERALERRWLDKWSVSRIAASRFWWLSENPVSVVEMAERGFDFQTKDVVIVDDVISSGSTIQKVRERHEPCMPRSRWHALTWVSQRNARLKGFFSVYAAVTVGTTNNKDPINSLSTLLTTEDVAKSYAQRNFSAVDGAQFLEVIRKLRQ